MSEFSGAAVLVAIFDYSGVLLIVGAVWLSASQPKWLRRMLGDRAITPQTRDGGFTLDPKMWMAKPTGQREIGRVAYSGSLLYRLQCTGILVMVLGLLVTDMVPEMNNSVLTLGLVVLAGYATYYAWTLRVVVDGNYLEVGRKQFDLTLLEALEERRDGVYRLEFSDGRHVEMSKYLDGRRELIDMLKHVLRINSQRWT